MADKTKIEWTDATWNIITGCSVVSAGCKHCYAMKLAGTRLAHHPSRTGLTVDTKNGPVWNGEVRFNEQWLLQPLRWTRSRMVFVCAHGDLFHESVPDAWIDCAFAVMAIANHHVFQVLTKRARRMREYLSAPDRVERIVAAALSLNGDIDEREVAHVWPMPHVWIGVSVEDQTAADERIPLLLQTPAAVRWISAEPLLGPIRLRRPWTHPGDDFEPGFGDARLDWCVVGGESGLKARPMHPRWARDLRDQCAAAGVPFLFKQWGEWAPRSGMLTGGGTDFAEIDPSCTRWPHVIRLGEHGRDTRIGENCTDDMGEEVYVQRVGKKAAGRLLDGVQHDGYPDAQS